MDKIGVVDTEIDSSVSWSFQRRGVFPHGERDPSVQIMHVNHLQSSLVAFVPQFFDGFWDTIPVTISSDIVVAGIMETDHGPITQ